MDEMKRPEWPWWLPKNAANKRVYERACNVWRLASLANPRPTEDDMAAAKSLYRRLAALSRLYCAHETQRCNGIRTGIGRKAYEVDGVLIKGRAAKLDTELARYGLHITYDEFYIGLRDGMGNHPVEVLV